MALGCDGDLSTKDCELLEDCCGGGGMIANLGLPRPRGDAPRTDPACLGNIDGDCCLRPNAALPVLDDCVGGINASLGDGFLTIACDIEFGTLPEDNDCLTGAAARCLITAVGTCLGLLPAEPPTAGGRASR